MATQNSTNFNSADFTVTSGAFDLNDAVIKSIVSDSGSVVPSANSTTIAGTNGVTTSAATNVITVSGASLSSDWVLVGTATASSDATVSFTGLDSTYYMYLVTFCNVYSTVGNSELNLLTSTDNGSSYDTGGSDYGFANSKISNTSNSVLYDIAAPRINIEDYISSTANSYSNGLVYLINPSDSVYTVILYQTFSIDEGGNDQENTSGTGCRRSAGDVNAIQLGPSSGNMPTGEFRVYGLKGS